MAALAEPDDAALAALLARCHTIAVLGVKDGEADAAFRVPRYLQAHGYRSRGRARCGSSSGSATTPAPRACARRGFEVVQDRCLMVEHARLRPSAPDRLGP